MAFILPDVVYKAVSQVHRFIFVWTNRYIHFDELGSRNAAVDIYKNKQLNTCDNTITATSLLAYAI